jgi:hypothetical protein
VVGHRDGDGGPRTVVHEKVKEAHNRAALGIVQSLVADDVCALQGVEHELDATLAHPGSACQRLVRHPDGAVLTHVTLLVGELAEQRVETNRTQSSRPGRHLANRLYCVEADLEERQIAPVANLDGAVWGAGAARHRWHSGRLHRGVAAEATR